MEYSDIVVTVKTNEIGVEEARNYKWVGKSPFISIPHPVLLDLVGAGGAMGEIQMGPYKLLQLDGSLISGDYWTYVRKDRLGKLRVFFYRSTRTLDFIYRRLIITLAVWNLAKYTECSIPTWRDIRLFNGDC